MRYRIFSRFFLQNNIFTVCNVINIDTKFSFSINSMSKLHSNTECQKKKLLKYFPLIHHCNRYFYVHCEQLLLLVTTLNNPFLSAPNVFFKYNKKFPE